MTTGRTGATADVEVTYNTDNGDYFFVIVVVCVVIVVSVVF